MEESQQIPRSTATIARSADERPKSVGVEAPSEHRLTSPTQRPDTAQLANDERFWREAIFTWQNLLQSKPKDPETLRYLKSCQAKLVEVLMLAGKRDEATEQNEALEATGRRLEEVRSAARPPVRTVAVVVSAALIAATLVWLLLHGAARSGARQEERPQKSDALETERKPLVADR